MDKGQALQQFWSGFGLPAYERYTVDEKAEMPYIAYDVAFGNFESSITLSAYLYYYDSGWAAADRKTQEIANAIGYSGWNARIDGGYISIKKQEPRFSEHGTDPNDKVRMVRLFVEVSFFTEN